MNPNLIDGRVVDLTDHDSELGLFRSLPRDLHLVPTVWAVGIDEVRVMWHEWRRDQPRLAPRQAAPAGLPGFSAVSVLTIVAPRPQTQTRTTHEDH